MKFAKYVIPLDQSAQESAYEMVATAKAAPWVGYGLHIFASGQKAPNGYGLGSSYLIWVTRDTGYYKNGSTYVQLYQASSDVTMVQMASVSIPDSIDSTLTTDVRYDQAAKTIRVAVNGVERLVCFVDTPLESGDTIALRTLGGPVEFTDLTVRTH